MMCDLYISTAPSNLLQQNGKIIKEHLSRRQPLSAIRPSVFIEGRQKTRPRRELAQEEDKGGDNLDSREAYIEQRCLPGAPTSLAPACVL